jgi:imidazoleglycerol phosphate synthase glutamine amidotransferase subunit HisH
VFHLSFISLLLSGFGDFVTVLFAGSLNTFHYYFVHSIVLLCTHDAVQTIAAEYEPSCAADIS